MLLNGVLLINMGFLFTTSVAELLLSERDLHGVCGSDFEAIESFSGCATLNFRRELNECDVVTTRNQANFFESWELGEQHAQHDFVGFVRQIGEEENLVWWLLRIRRVYCRLCWIHSLRLFHPKTTKPLSVFFSIKNIKYLLLLFCGLWRFWFLRSLLESSLSLCDNIGLRFGVINSHRFIVKGESLHCSQCIGGACDLFENYKGLSTHLQCFECDDVQNLAELRENRVQRLLQFILLHLFIQIVDVNRVARSNIHD